MKTTNNNFKDFSLWERNFLKKLYLEYLNFPDNYIKYYPSKLELIKLFYYAWKNGNHIKLLEEKYIDTLNELISIIKNDEIKNYLYEILPELKKYTDEKDIYDELYKFLNDKVFDEKKIDEKISFFDKELNLSNEDNSGNNNDIEKYILIDLDTEIEIDYDKKLDLYKYYIKDSWSSFNNEKKIKYIEEFLWILYSDYFGLFRVFFRNLNFHYTLKGKVVNNIYRNWNHNRDEIIQNCISNNSYFILYDKSKYDISKKIYDKLSIIKPIIIKELKNRNLLIIKEYYEKKKLSKNIEFAEDNLSNDWKKLNNYENENDNDNKIFVELFKSIFLEENWFIPHLKIFKLKKILNKYKNSKNEILSKIKDINNIKEDYSDYLEYMMDNVDDSYDKVHWLVKLSSWIKELKKENSKIDRINDFIKLSKEIIEYYDISKYYYLFTYEKFNFVKKLEEFLWKVEENKDNLDGIYKIFDEFNKIWFKKMIRDEIKTFKEKLLKSQEKNKFDFLITDNFKNYLKSKLDTTKVVHYLDDSKIREILKTEIKNQ